MSSVEGGQVTFTLTKQGKGMTSQHSRVMHRAHGKVTTFAYTGAFERNKNPDGDVTYGFRHLNKSCLSKIPGQVPARYTGIVDTHPYSTATSGDTTYVGDAAGNDILRIDSAGHIKLVTVLPPVSLLVTAHRAKVNHLPACAVGHRYWFEPVPTDVEVSPSGELVVTTLTGATEAPGFGGQSRVYRVDPVSGATTLVAKGLAGAVGVAIAANGSYLVSQLFGNEVSRVDASTGAVSHYRTVSQPAAVERAGGKVVRHRPRPGPEAGGHADPFRGLIGRLVGTGSGGPTSEWTPLFLTRPAPVIALMLRWADRGPLPGPG